jgi:hypothetical protein
MKLPRVLKASVLVLATLVLVTTASFLMGAVAQRSCWPRFCAAAAAPVTSVIESTHARIKSEHLPLPFSHLYGALEVLDSSFIIAAGNGALYQVNNQRAIRRLPFSVPLVDTEFNRDNGTTGIQLNSFSVKDILVRRRGDDVELLATYHVWFAERKCYVLRVSSATANGELTELRSEWRTVFDTSPCARLKNDGVRFAGTGAGGRMTRLSDTEVLVTVGDHEFDATLGTSAQDPRASFGKTISINTATRQANMYTLGHRNPQGLLRTRDGRIWSTEHGPKGGDELNLLESGRNYGWPHATHGAQYQEYDWPLRPSAAQANAFIDPVYAWVPSIGISQLIEVEGRKFTRWAGDLLVASLRGSSLYRVHLNGERVVFAEQIKVDGARIRDLAEHPDGTIALLSQGQLLLLEPADEGDREVAAAERMAVSVTPSLVGGIMNATRNLISDLAGLKK